MELIKVKIIDAHRTYDDDCEPMESLHDFYGFNNGDIIEVEKLSDGCVYLAHPNGDSFLRKGEYEVVEW